MHAIIREALSGYLHEKLSAEQLMDWVTANLGKVIPSCDSRATLLLGHIFALLADFDEGRLCESLLREHLARLYAMDGISMFAGHGTALQRLAAEAATN